MDTRVNSIWVERVLKSFAFSVSLFLIWGTLTVMSIPSLRDFEPIEISVVYL